MGIFSSWFFKHQRKDEMIEWAIEMLGVEGSALGTAYKEISYSDVVSYMRRRHCTVLNSIKGAQNGWVDFEASIKGQKYVATLSRTFEGYGSVLTSEKA